MKLIVIGCLCIHGFTGGPYEIEPLTDILKEKTDWIISIPTLPGHGKELALDDVTHEDWLNHIDEAYQKLAEQVDTIYLIGFSMGGMMAANLAAKYPVDRLVMLSPSRKYLCLSKMASEVKDLIKDRVTGEIEENLTYKNYQHKKGLIPFKAYVEFAKCIAKTRSSLENVTCPVLVLQGIEDGLVPYQSTHSIVEEISGEVEVIYYLDSKHLICLGDDQEVVVSAVYNYLTSDNASMKKEAPKLAES